MKGLVAIWSVVAVSLALVLGAKGTQGEAGVASKVWWLDNPARVSGAEVPDAFSILQRGYFSLTVRVHTSGLSGGHNYSVWWVVFQDPAACSGGCGDDDINAVIASGANPVGIGVHFGGTFIAPAGGEIVYSSRVMEDIVEDCAKVPPYSAVCAPLRDAATANALVFLIDHGPLAEGVPPATTFDAGCRGLVWFGYVVAQYNKGAFDCYRAQSTYHTP